MGSITEISLFSGYGGFSLGLRLAGVDVRTVCYVENDPYCQRIINQRIADGHLDEAPLWDDIKTFDGGPWSGQVGIITAGFPCQPHSTAGKRLGEADERNLWPDTLRVIGEVGPEVVLLENVPGILVEPGYAGTVVGQLSEFGYDCRWGLVPAAAVGAPHLRWRWWCLGWNADTVRRSGDDRSERSIQFQDTNANRNGHDGDVAYAQGERRTLRSATGERPGRPPGSGAMAYTPGA